jgi:hypothetical protein
VTRVLQDAAYQAPDRLDIVHHENQEARHWNLGKARWSYNGSPGVKGYGEKVGDILLVRKGTVRERLIDIRASEP